MQTVPAAKPRYIQLFEINSVGFEQLDAERKHLVSLINRMFDLVSETSGSDNVPFAGGILVEIAEYTNVHFEHEERVLASVQYPDLNKHRAIHRSLQSKTLEMQQRFDRRPTYDDAKDILHFLKDWWTTHINSTDVAYVPHLTGRPTRSET
jgi:hemerythrin